MSEPVLRVTDLVKTYPSGVRAVDGVSLTVPAGGTLGLVGESGCGKSTVARSVLRLVEADAGQILFEGRDLRTLRGRALREARSRVQLVPQHPDNSLNPRMTIGESIEFNLLVHGWRGPARRDRVARMLDAVGLPAALASRYPHQISGGQAQRVAIARALATRPSLIICDEPVSALDKSVQAQVLNLLSELQRDVGVALLFISHDLAVVEHMADTVAVMYLGRVVEEAAAGHLWRGARHPYTQALLSAVPGGGRTRIVLTGEPPSPRRRPPGCAFAARCPAVHAACSTTDPAPVLVAPDHRAACLLVTAAHNGGREPA
ncbi:ABC transporter ATP-binding protein [Dactylosporangium sp. CA-092794]|uniref:ABC transporter ATP-binding protein n=1 Tax=Dactylosporangium sp. CA-092794 TaxID=3239929 RepID=UPI003D949DBB